MQAKHSDDDDDGEDDDDDDEAFSRVVPEGDALAYAFRVSSFRKGMRS